ncbi:MAG: phosphatidylcholine/phosphatidylserine synthase [Alphaproteobacteria bacterium]|nr:MAG: phosphatidylcholine/phosphatidylserine synthase [Alphaproteobacteria bacterium]
MSGPTSTQIAAWAVHGLTASGVIFGAMALLAIAHGDPRMALGLLMVAFVIDGIDGPLARRVNVQQVLPRVDGSVLDLIVDYITYVFVPVAFLYRFEMLPHEIVFWGAALILLSSLYLFSNRDMKSKDQFFVGFPAVWNLVVFYLFILGTPALVNMGVVVLMSVLTFLPIKAVHPLRVTTLRPITYVLTAVWLVESFVILWAWPAPMAQLIGLWVLTGFYFVAISAWRTLWGEILERD